MSLEEGKFGLLEKTNPVSKHFLFIVITPVFKYYS